MNFLHISSLQIEFFKAAALKFKNLKPIGTGMSQKETNCVLCASLAASPPVSTHTASRIGLHVKMNAFDKYWLHGKS